MQIFGKILEILNTEMAVPKMYGLFHITFLVIVGAVCILICRKPQNETKWSVQRVLLVSALLPVVLEIYKQINHTFIYDGVQINTDYPWYIFPFQFCSTPMYVSLAAYIAEKGKLHDSLCAFLATFSVFAGICVMLYPEQVFIKTVGINLQTMICHSTMIITGVYLFKNGHVPVEHRTIVKAVPVFLVCVAIAVIMNETAYLFGILKNETFNMFFISPYCEPHLPVYSLVQAIVPFPWCVLIYIMCFTAAAYIVLLTVIAGKYIFFKINKKQRRTPLLYY